MKENKREYYRLCQAATVCDFTCEHTVPQQFMQVATVCDGWCDAATVCDRWREDAAVIKAVSGS